MSDEAESDILEAAQLLQELALAYAGNTEEAPAELIRQFGAAAAGLTEEVGDLEVTNEDDELLILAADGRFTGRVLVDEPSPHWQSLESAEEVAEHYDTADLFADVADALADAFPGLDHADVPQGMPEPAPALPPGEQLVPVPPADGEPGYESATLLSLRDLHAAGVLSDEQFEAKRAELHQ